jgi:hypothetical protein
VFSGNLLSVDISAGINGISLQNEGSEAAPFGFDFVLNRDFEFFIRGVLVFQFTNHKKQLLHAYLGIQDNIHFFSLCCSD